ncbi:MAG: C40 family peptidase, partial [Bacteroidales bacterium]
MKFERFTKLLILNILFFFSAALAQANTPFQNQQQNEDTTSILKKMESTLLSNIRLITPPIHLKESTLDERLETYYEEFFDNLISGAHKLIGTPYRIGGRSPKGFDCSGFTSYIFSRYGVKLSQSSRSQINDGRKIARSEVKKGDLIFFRGRNSASNVIGHVGIVTDSDKNGNIRFI